MVSALTTAELGWTGLRGGANDGEDSSNGKFGAGRRTTRQKRRHTCALSNTTGHRNNTDQRCRSAVSVPIFSVCQSFLPCLECPRILLSCVSIHVARFGGDTDMRLSAVLCMGWSERFGPDMTAGARPLPPSPTGTGLSCPSPTRTAAPPRRWMRALRHAYVTAASQLRHS